MLQREACAWLLSPSLQHSDAHSEERQVPGRQGGGDGESRGKNDQTPNTLRITAVVPVLASIFFHPSRLPAGQESMDGKANP